MSAGLKAAPSLESMLESLAFTWKAGLRSSADSSQAVSMNPLRR